MEQVGGLDGRKLTKHPVREVDQIHLRNRTREGSIEPLDIIIGEIVLPERVVNEDTLPLAALGLVGSDGVGVLDL